MSTSPAACGSVSGYTLGCGPGGAAFGIPTRSFHLHDLPISNDLGRRSLQLPADQGRDEERQVRYLCLDRLYLFPELRQSATPTAWARNIGATYFPLPGWQKLDWGLSQINLNHDFTASVIYDLPFGKGKQFGSDWNGALNTILGNWEVTVIEKVTSGFPVFVVDSDNGSGVNFENNGNSLNRPNQICIPR